MGRPRRQICSGEIYEICMRTRKGLPFVATRYMNLILESVIARVQRDHKVTLCHFLWMANHPHIIIQAKDSLQCTRFYGEIKKQLTEAVKRLLGRKHLCLWQKNGTSVVRYGDLDGVVHRIAYLYANPANANLVDNITLYPGLSSWTEFKESTDTLMSEHKKLCPRVPLSTIPKLPSPSVTPSQDKKLVQQLKESTKKKHFLTLYPNAWMRFFGIEVSGVSEVNQSIKAALLEFEAEARAKRSKEKWKTKGAERLRKEPLTLNYRSKKDSRRISIYAACSELRIRMIEEYRDFCDRCQECYERWKIGEYRVEWPPGSFLPAMPPRYNVIAF